jgi:cysteinyl-tRNA synthetase
LQAALVRLKRMVSAWERVRAMPVPKEFQESSLDALLGDPIGNFDSAISDDLNSPRALTIFEDLLHSKHFKPHEKGVTLLNMDSVLGLELATILRTDLRIRPSSATITEAEIEAFLAQRKEARAAKDFATSDRLRDELAVKGVDVMDGDPLGWDWKLD